VSRPTLRELDDLKLALLARTSADTDAYGVLAERHYPSLRAFLLRMTGDRSQADDLAQDALIRGFERIGSFRADAAFRTWLFSIAHREFLQSRRKAGAIRRMIERFTEPHDSKHAGEAIDTHDLRKGLSALREDERAALLLADALGMSHSEVAEAISAPLGSVKTWVRRARGKMRAAMGDDDVDRN
jgi:RNA polymerase sigma-70 factor (ECF subfamily)